MPLALDPQQTFSVVLESDKSQPRPPRWVFRYLTARQFQRVARLQASLDEAAGDEDVIDRLVDAVRIGLVEVVDLVNQQGYSVTAADDLADVLTVFEIQELIVKLTQQLPTFEDKKKFDSSSPSATAAPANDAKA